MTSFFKKFKLVSILVKIGSHKNCSSHSVEITNMQLTVHVTYIIGTLNFRVMENVPLIIVYPYLHL